MVLSIQSNQAALLALLNLNRTSDQLTDVQARVSSGFAVSEAKDNPSTWAIAQGQRSDVSALDSVKTSLNRAASVADTALSAGQSISDLLNQIKAKVVAASDTTLDAPSRAAVNDEFQALLRQMSGVVSKAAFDGSNLLDGSSGAHLRFLANADATAYLTLSAKNMTLSGSIITLSSTETINAVGHTASVLAAVEASITNVNTALGDIGAQARQIDAHSTFVAQLSDVLTGGVSSLVDADVAAEGALLKALQVRQQLGVQSLGIANSAPQTILSLFK